MSAVETQAQQIVSNLQAQGVHAASTSGFFDTILTWIPKLLPLVTICAGFLGTSANATPKQVATKAWKGRRGKYKPSAVRTVVRSLEDHLDDSGERMSHSDMTDTAIEVLERARLAEDDEVSAFVGAARASTPTA